MTQLLISVKNVDEAFIALAAGVDVIDLKDPGVGALGALDLVMTEQIVAAIQQQAIVSATVGEQHATLDELEQAILARAELGVDIIKMAVSGLFYTPDFFLRMLRLSNAGIKMMAVFFADENIDLTLIDKLRQTDFYGAMLDTQNKHFSLLELVDNNCLQRFIVACEGNQLKSGLAGSLKPHHVAGLNNLNPTYIGFRGGVCDHFLRNTTLSPVRIDEAKKMLREHNNSRAKAQESSGSALHT